MHDFSSAFTPGCVRETDGEKEREKIDADGRLCTFLFLRFISSFFTFIGLPVLDFIVLDGLDVCVCVCVRAFGLTPLHTCLFNLNHVIWHVSLCRI